MAILSLSSSQKRRRSAGVTDPRFLISVTVLGSAGPIRFVASEGDTVAAVISIALRFYSHQGRRPALGSDRDDFLLYPVNAGFDVLSSSEKIGSSGSRAFVLCKKQQVMMPPQQLPAPVPEPADPITWQTPLERKASGGLLKSWLSNLRISSL